MPVMCYIRIFSNEIIIGLNDFLLVMVILL